jgi:hypothetical protein
MSPNSFVKHLVKSRSGFDRFANQKLKIRKSGRLDPDTRRMANRVQRALIDAPAPSPHARSLPANMGNGQPHPGAATMDFPKMARTKVRRANLGYLSCEMPD